MTVYRDDGSNLSNLNEREKVVLLSMFEQLPNLKPRPKKAINQLVPGIGSGMLQFIPSQQQLSTDLADGAKPKPYRQLQLDRESAMTAGDKLLRLEKEIEKLGLLFASLETVQALVSDLFDTQEEDTDDALSIAVRGLLGGTVRELVGGDTFGERAMEGSAVRTASVVTMDVCHFMTLGVEEYNAFVKMRFKEMRDEKHQLLVEKFPGYSRLPTEDLWKFQYLFQTKTAKVGRSLINEHATNNRAILVKRGQVAVYKHAGTVELLLDWFNNLDYHSKNNVELLELINRAIKLFGAIPHKQSVLVGYVDKPELLGSEILFNSKHRSLFSVKVVSSELEYYEIGSSVETYLSLHGIKPHLLDALVAVLRYRLEFIYKRLYVFGQVSQLGGRSQYLKLTDNSRLRKELQQAADPPGLSQAETGDSRKAQVAAVARKFSSQQETKLLQLLRHIRPDGSEPATKAGLFEVQEKTAVFSSADMLRFIQKEARRDPSLASHISRMSRSPAPKLAQPKATHGKSASLDQSGPRKQLQSSVSHLQTELSPHIRKFYMKRVDSRLQTASTSQLLVTYAAQAPKKLPGKQRGYVDNLKQVLEFNRRYSSDGRQPPRDRRDSRFDEI